MKLDASDNLDREYKKKFGVNFMDEDTLIIGDDMNSVLMVYQDENDVVTEDITSLIHVLNRLCITPQCIIHKRMEPSKTPPHIKINLNFVQNNIQNANTILNAHTIQTTLLTFRCHPLILTPHNATWILISKEVVYVP